MSGKRGLSRRELLQAGAATVSLVSLDLLAACSPGTPTPTPGQPAAPTKALTAPATTAPQAKPAEPTKAPAPTAATAPTQPKLGATLIGKLEGPEVITDPARFPKAFKEAPQLAELVKAGKLPQVKERIGEDPLVVKPVHEIGKYGGTWRRGFTGPADNWNGVRAASGPDKLLFFDYTGDKIVPNIAKGWELSPDGKTTTVFLRRGMKWSDGQPFTADDFVFWFEDMYSNKDLVPVPSAFMSINGKPGVVEKVDLYTVRWRFPEPYYLFPQVLAGTTNLSLPSLQGGNAMGSYAPAHYLKQFHPKYTSKEDLDKKVKDAKVDNWVGLFKAKNSWHLNPDLPVVSPWRTVTPANTPIWSLERNPYSIWVDVEGNQLPYIDKIVMTLAESLEILNLRAIAGEYDFQARHIDMQKLPVFLENQSKGGYKIHLDTSDQGTDLMVRFNLTYDADPEIAKWLNTTDFRRALSLGFDRDQLNETFWLGTGTPGSPVPADHNRYNPGPEYRKLWATYDPQKANEMLDKLGLDKKDSEGYRLRTDGKGRLRLQVTVPGAAVMPLTQIMEMIAQHWRKIGIQADVQELERSLAFKRAETNEHQMFVWTLDGIEHLFIYTDIFFPVSAGSPSGPLIGRWYATGGAQGKEPTGKMREVLELLRKAYGVPEAEQVSMGKQIWKICADEVFNIGVVGVSAALLGTRVAKVKMGNVPARQYNSPEGLTPSASRPVTFYWKE